MFKTKLIDIIYSKCMSHTDIKTFDVSIDRVEYIMELCIDYNIRYNSVSLVANSGDIVDDIMSILKSDDRRPELKYPIQRIKTALNIYDGLMIVYNHKNIKKFENNKLMAEALFNISTALYLLLENISHDNKYLETTLINIANNIVGLVEPYIMKDVAICGIRVPNPQAADKYNELVDEYVQLTTDSIYSIESLDIGVLDRIGDIKKELDELTTVHVVVSVGNESVLDALNRYSYILDINIHEITTEYVRCVDEYSFLDGLSKFSSSEYIQKSFEKYNVEYLNYCGDISKLSSNLIIDILDATQIMYNAVFDYRILNDYL